MLLTKRLEICDYGSSHLVILDLQSRGKTKYIQGCVLILRRVLVVENMLKSTKSMVPEIFNIRFYMLL
jgi:hypothetical protein